MNYICLVYQEEAKLRAIPDERLSRVAVEVGEWVNELEAKGQHVHSSGLQSIRSAATLRYDGTEISVTDGPFAETKEVLGGFTVLSARDLNEAIQLASKLAIACLGTVEVRPAMDINADLADPLDQKVASCIRLAVQTSA